MPTHILNRKEGRFITIITQSKVTVQVNCLKSTLGYKKHKPKTF